VTEIVVAGPHFVAASRASGKQRGEFRSLQKSGFHALPLRLASSTCRRTRVQHSDWHNRCSLVLPESGIERFADAGRRRPSSKVLHSGSARRSTRGR
jgi:hypothetical protein